MTVKWLDYFSFSSNMGLQLGTWTLSLAFTDFVSIAIDLMLDLITVKLWIWTRIVSVLKQKRLTKYTIRPKSYEDFALWNLQSFIA